MTLHNAIVQLLRQQGRPMTTTEIADALNRNKWYTKKDGSAITPFQINGRTKNYTQLFQRNGTTVSLIGQPNIKFILHVKAKTEEIKQAPKTLSEFGAEHAMKFLFNLLFIVIPFLSIAQTSTEYFADRYLSKKTTEKKAKFILKNTDHPDGTNIKEVMRMSDNTIISREHYKGEEPIGIWIVSRNNKLTELNYDFPLIYGDYPDCIEDSSTFIPAQKMAHRDPLFDFDSIGYVAPIGDFSRQDMLNQLFYPYKAIDEGLMGEVFVGYRISSLGENSAVWIIKRVHPLLDKEAVRCYRLLKFRTSAFVNGVPKAICVKQRLTFKME